MAQKFPVLAFSCLVLIAPLSPSCGNVENIARRRDAAANYCIIALVTSFVASAAGSLACNRQNSLQFISSGWDVFGETGKRLEKVEIGGCCVRVLYVLMTDVADERH